MASTSPDKEAVRASLSKDTRNISVIWNEAIRKYNETAREDKKTANGVLITPNYKDAQAMKVFGNNEMQRFEKFRDDGKKMGKLKTLFMQNIDFIEAGSKQLLSAVSASFPPALAISTAMTFVLSGFRSVSADYDMVVNFFEDMNNFLQRVTIIAERVPRKDAYQNALMDVFASMLSLCGAARNYIVLGKFKKWVINSVFGEDTALKGGRQQMDTSLARLQSATELAILDNTENMLDQQAEMSTALSKMRRELDRNGEMQEQIAASQIAATEKISDDVQTMMKDIKKLLSLQQEVKAVKSQDKIESDELSGNVVRHFYGLVLKSKTKPFPDMLAVLANLEKSQVEGTGSWLFEHPDWIVWADFSETSPCLLRLEGRPGMGKTYLSLSIYQHLYELRNAEQEVCVAYFSCHRPDEQRRHATDLLRNCAIQIADQSPVIRQKLESMWRKFQIHEGIRVDDIIWTEDNEIFVFDNFRENSGNQLFVVIDGIDEFHYEEIVRFNNLIRKVDREKLQIKFVVTSDAIDTIPSQCIRIAKQQILPDLRKIVWERINSEDSAYEGLRKLSKHYKQKLARNIEHNANDLLYVEQTLLFLADIVRDGGTIEDLLDVIPASLTQLYEVIVAKFQQSLSPEATESLRHILTWLIVSQHPLTTEWVDLLVNSSTGLDDAQVQSLILRFFELDILSNDTTSVLDIGLSELFEESMDVSTEKLLSTNNLRLQPRNRATKIFFVGAGPEHALHSSNSDAHRRVFLDTVDIIVRKKASNKSLYDYSIEHSIQHWHDIVPEEHTEEEQAEVCTKFFALISDARFAEGLLQHPYCYCLEQLTQAGWGKNWDNWSSRASTLPVSSEVIEYWQDEGNAMYPLLVLFVRCWLQSVDVDRAVKAWRWAKSVKKDVHRESLWQYEDYEIPQLAAILGTELDSHAHFAIASVLNLPEIFELVSDAAEADMEIDLPSATDKFHLALKGCQDAALQTQCYIQLAWICIREKRWHDAIESCRLALDNEQVNVQEDINKTDADRMNVHAESIAPQVSARAELLRIRAVATRGLGMNMEAAESFREARQLSTEIVPAEHLFKELSCLQESHAAMIDRLLSFESIDRLHFLTGGLYDLGGEVRLPPTRLILPAVAKSQKIDEVIKTYRELIEALDTEQAGAPVRVDLARILWRLRSDTKEVKLLLNQVLDDVSEERRYKLTDREPLDVANSTLLLMVDILLEEFRSSKKIEDKVQILLQARELPHRKFLASQPLITDAVWDPYSIAVAYMLRKIGPMSEWEQVMRTIFEKAIAGQTDDTDLNDSVYLISLSRILMMIPSLRKYGEMLYALHEAKDPEVDEHLDDYDDEEEEEEEEEGGNDADDEEVERNQDDKSQGTPSYCDGICLPVTVLKHFDPLKPHHKCLICADVRLCQSCYETRKSWNANPQAKSVTDLDFCCSNGLYMRIPMEGLRRVEGRTLHFETSKEGDKPTSIHFTQLIEDIKLAWEKAWEGLASGI